MHGEVIENQGSLVVVLNKPFLDRVLTKVDEASIAKAIVDKIKDEIIHRVISTYDYRSLEQEVARQVKQDVGRVVMAQYDQRIRAAVKAVMTQTEEDFGGDKTPKGTKAKYMEKLARRKENPPKEV